LVSLLEADAHGGIHGALDTGGVVRGAELGVFGGN